MPHSSTKVRINLSGRAEVLEDAAGVQVLQFDEVQVGDVPVEGLDDGLVDDEFEERYLVRFLMAKRGLDALQSVQGDAPSGFGGIRSSWPTVSKWPSLRRSRLASWTTLQSAPSP